ncbi:flagellar motor switch protein FliN [Lentisphaerota bacterium WC36G]|nr:flagellar motor switch protein FliN [Lentisphaerae bacterium WC36]
MPTDNTISQAEFSEMNQNTNQPTTDKGNMQKNLQMLFDIPVTVSAQLGQAQVKVSDLINLNTGSVIELNRLAGESVDLMVNGVVVGKGDVVVVNDNFGIRITEIICSEDRVKNLSS